MKKNLEKDSRFRIAIVGKAASGKDLMKRRFVERGMKPSVSYTTRPPREGEVDGIDYNFITEETAREMIKAGEFYEYVEFNKWIYATSKKQFFDSDVLIMTPAGIAQLSTEDRKTTTIIYVDIDRLIRIERLNNRKMPGDSMYRRLDADELDFENFSDYDIRINNANF